MLASHQATLERDISCVPCALHRQFGISIGRPSDILVFPAAMPLSMDRLSELSQLGLAVLYFSERWQSYSVCQVWHELFGVAKAALTDIEALSLPAHEVFRVE